MHNAQYWGELEYILSSYSNFPTNFGEKNQLLLEVGFFLSKEKGFIKNISPYLHHYSALNFNILFKQEDISEF